MLCFYLGNAYWENDELLKEREDLQASESASKAEIEKLRCRVQALENTLVANHVQMETQWKSAKHEPAPSN